MDSKLYLDTARVGRMTIGAQRACGKAVELAQSDPQLIYQAIINPGANSGVTLWTGLDGISSSIRKFTDCPDNRKLVTASNSASLVKLAARSLFLVSRRLLVTDLIWPNHLEELKKECHRTNNELQVVPVRHLIAKQGWHSGEISELITTCYDEQDCDALFLTAVSYDGIRLPLDSIFAVIGRSNKVRLSVVDGAQEFAHCDAKLKNLPCDLYLFGSHKWLGAYHPMSLGLYGKRRSGDFLEQTLERLIATREVCDPLLKFTFSLQTGRTDEPNETVNFLPLLATSGAIDDLAQRPAGFQTRLTNARRFVDIAKEAGWQSANRFSDPSFETGIVVLSNRKNKMVHPTVVESSFFEQGIVLTGYPGGRIRASMPIGRFTVAEEKLVAAALNSVACAGS